MSTDYSCSVTRTRNLILWAIPSLLLILLAFQCLSSAWGTGQTVDETYYNGSGYAMIRHHNYTTLGEHPPLIMKLASLPLLAFQPHFPIENMVYLPNSNAVDISKTGVRFLYESGNDPQKILFWERMVIALMTTILGAVLFIWARQLYGFAGGLVSLAFFCFSPDMIAHGSLFTTDMGLTFFFFLTIFSLYNFFERPLLQRALWVGLFCGLALLSKISALILLPVVVGLFIFNYFEDKPSSLPQVGSPKSIAFLAGLILFFALGGNRTIIGLLPVCLLMFSVLFTELRTGNSKKGLAFKLMLSGGWVACLVCSALAVKKGWLFPLIGFFWVLPLSLVSYYIMTRKVSERLLSTIKILCLICLIAALVIALGYFDFYKTIPRLKPFAHYIRSFSIAFSHSTSGHEVCAADSFVACDWRYFFSALAVKVPVATLLLWVLGLGALIFSPLRQRHKLMVFFPVIVYFIIASFLNKINIGVRHILPVYPFLFLAAGAIGYFLSRLSQSVFRKIGFLALITLFVQVAVRHFYFFPDFISYHNEFIPSHERAAAILADSNINWGQDNKRLVDYVKAHNIPFIKIKGSALNPDLYNYYGIKWSQISDADLSIPIPGYYAIDTAAYLAEQGNSRSLFYARTPDARIGKTFYLYKID